MTLYQGHNAFILIYAKLYGPLEKAPGLPLGHGPSVVNQLTSTTLQWCHKI